MKIRFVLAALLSAVAAPAHADWYEASSDHFVIYADDREADVREFATNLERYQSAMEFITGKQDTKPSPSARVTVFVVGGQSAMNRLSGDRFVGGFYSASAGFPRAFVQDIHNTNRSFLHVSTITLLHEYTHHFLITSSRVLTPRWVTEGAAEFFSSASFEKDGSMYLGRPNQHRSLDFAYARDLKIEALLDTDIYEEQKGNRYDQFYARSWLLYHYLMFGEGREGQLIDYRVAVANGKPSLEAAREVFGDLNQLDHDMDRYLKQRKMTTYHLTPEKIKTGKITLRRLPAGEAEMMDVRIVSQHGVSREEALKLLPKAQAIAAKYPNDPGVLTALAEAEVDAGNEPAAIVAADRAIALDPTRVNAYLQKGRALFRQAGEAEDQAAAYKKAMEPYSALNKIENDHPLPLIAYYRSFTEQGLEPNETARHALERASELAPFDLNLTMNTGLMLATEGKIALARKMLLPVAYNPHASEMAEKASGYLESLKNVDEGTVWRPDPSLALPAYEESNEDESDGVSSKSTAAPFR